MVFKMDLRLIIILCLTAVMLVSAYPSEPQELRSKRDVMESMNAWNEVVRTMSDAGDAIVHAFKLTEKSVLGKIEDEMNVAGESIVNVFKPTEKSVFTKMSEGMGLTK